MQLNLECPYNNLSFGYISYGITRGLYQLGIAPNIFPISNNVDLSSFDKMDEGFKQYLQSCINKAPTNFKKNFPSLKIWHISSSWQKVSEPSFILTFHELDSLTQSEVNILNSFEKVFVTSRYSEEIFKTYGVPRTHFVPMGIDTVHFRKLEKKYLNPDIVSFSLFGKFEARKWTKKAIQGWVKKYGNNQKFRLNLYVTNPFFKPEQMNAAYADIFNNQKPPWNVSPFGYLPTLSHLNDAYNGTNIVIDMSGGESISLPSLNCLALGKHGVIHNCSAMRDWAGKGGATLVEPSSKVSCVDNIFFHPNQPFNDGNIFSWEEDAYIAALEILVQKFQSNPINTEGFKLVEEYSFENGTKRIVELISETK